jgi:hypothetical protein
MSIAAGDKIDIRDNKNIWHEARVTRTYLKNFSNRIKFIKFRYIDSTIEDELPESSHKIAPFGLYTSREELPKVIGGLKCVKNEN